jgi:hypothetical protein
MEIIKYHKKFPGGFDLTKYPCVSDNLGNIANDRVRIPAFHMTSECINPVWRNIYLMNMYTENDLVKLITIPPLTPIEG